MAGTDTANTPVYCAVIGSFELGMQVYGPFLTGLDAKCWANRQFSDHTIAIIPMRTPFNPRFLDWAKVTEVYEYREKI